MDQLGSDMISYLNLSLGQLFYLLNVSSVIENEESCGLIAGIENIAKIIYPITNTLHSKTRFRMKATEQIDAMIEIERRGMDLLAIYHTHIEGPGHPSIIDTEEFSYPGVVYLIINLLTAKQIIRGFHLIAGQWQEIPIVIIG